MYLVAFYRLVLTKRAYAPIQATVINNNERRIICANPPPPIYTACAPFFLEKRN